MDDLPSIYRAACVRCNKEFIAFSHDEAFRLAADCQYEKNLKVSDKHGIEHSYKIGDIVESAVEPRDAPGCGGPRRAKVMIARIGYTKKYHYPMYIGIEEKNNDNYPNFVALCEYVKGQIDYFGLVDLKVRRVY